MNKTVKRLIIFAVIAGLGTWGWMQFSDKKAIEKPTFVTVKRDSIRLSITTTGQVTPRNRVEIKPPISGRIDRVLVEEGQRVKKGQVLAYMSSTERAVILDSVQSEGAQSVKKWETLYKATPVVAPISGFVINRSTQPGQSVSVSDPIVVLADTFIVKAYVDETDLSRIKMGQRASIELDAFPESKLKSTVTHIAYEAQQVNNVTIYLVDVEPQFLDSSMPLRSGMGCRVTFQGERRDDVLVVPSRVLTSKRGQMGVMVQVDGKPQFKTVELGLSDGKKVEVVSGLQEGDLILDPKLNLSKGKKTGSPFAPGGNNNRNSRRQGS